MEEFMTALTYVDKVLGSEVIRKMPIFESMNNKKFKEKFVLHLD